MHRVDVCVVGGGMAGLVAAVAAARRGASVVLVHDRPVLGGNASSEVRMWICGAHGHHRKETGILEEIQLTNLARNPSGLYSVWDSVLFEFAAMTPGLTTLLNCSVNDAKMRGRRLRSVQAWQLTTQCWHTIEADCFIDCSGDSILAPLTGAEVRHGRESREEFNESIAPRKADLKTMGNTLLLQLEEMGQPQAFTPPPWAYTFDQSTTLPSRVGNGLGHNFWWIELGGLLNTIDDAESIRDDLLKTGWGVWDYMKNKGPQAEKLRNWRLRWLGALPGKRENRRYLGDHILTQNDVEAEGRFEDIVAYGGWSMDDHHPAGLFYPGAPTIFHRAPSPYGIPLRSLYSRNVPNLLCAGRNISATHSALSSTRVMATCAVIGQAVGTAAALCCRYSLTPRDITGRHLKRLQQWLMDDDCWLPGKRRPADRLTREARLAASDGSDPSVLLSGQEREPDKITEHWAGAPGTKLTLTWPEPRKIKTLRLVFDSDLNDVKRMPCLYPAGGHSMALPQSLVKGFKIEAKEASGRWKVIHRESNNSRRLVILPLNIEAKALRWTGESTWGHPQIKLYSLDVSARTMPVPQTQYSLKTWAERAAEVNPADLAPPDNNLEPKRNIRVGA